MPRILALVFASLLIANPASAATILIEDFEAAFPAWETGWLGLNSNTTNYYGVGQYRGNNPDGLWIDDGDGVEAGDSLVDIQFGAFGTTLTAFSIDLAGYPGVFRIYDSLGGTLLTAPVPTNDGWQTDPGSYTNYGVLSVNGVGGFSFAPTTGQIEGNTSIDNVQVTVGGGAAPVPEPTSMLLLGTGALGLVAKLRRRGRKHSQ